MSKYSKSGKRSQSGAGNHFDKLLKVCSNSKVAGSLGRFGVASFTSIRSTANNNGEEETEKKPKSKYSSLKKRSKIDSSKNNTNTSSVYNLPPQLSTSSLSNMSPGPTVFKPRKFFKSRGPMEVEANSQPKPVRPEVSNLMPVLPPSSMSPLIPTNTNTNLQFYSSDQVHPKKHKKGSKKLEIFSSPSSAMGSSSDSSFTSPPIKLRIFKDRGKFVAEAPSPVTPTTVTPAINTASPGKKRGRKPGSKNKKQELEFEEQKPPKQTKRARTAATAPAPAPRVPSGRTTRNSTRQRVEPESEEMDSSGMPSLDRELRNSLDGSFQTDTGDMFQPPPPQLMVDSSAHSHNMQSMNDSPLRSGQPTQEIIKKLEEDADFKKLSEMLSSMESESAQTSSSSYSQHQQQDFNNVQQQPYHHQQQNNMESGYPNPVNLSAGGGSNNSRAPHGLSAFAAQAYLQQQSRQQMQQQQHQDQSHIHHHQIEHQQQNQYDSNMDIGYNNQAQQQTSSSVQLPQQQNLPKANDIRSILVDDWTDFDDETHSPTGHNRSRPSSQASHHSQSPPKFSRFDMTAFMPSGSGGSNKDHQQQQSPQFPPPEMDHVEQHHHQQFSSDQQLPFNMHSSPYAMRNLLNCPQDGQEIHFASQQGHDMSHQQQQASGQGHFSSCAMEALQQHHHTAPLNSLSSCAKQEAISVLDSVLKQQQEVSSDPNLVNANLPPPSAALSKPQVAPSTRKASIFKSRARDQNQNGEGGQIGMGSDTSNNTKVSKGRALYKHKFGGGQEESSEEHRQQISQSSSSVFSEFDEEDDDVVMKNLRNVRIKNVKGVHQLQESGEFHEFDGDVQYILEDLRGKNPLNIRCLSALTLATRCMEPSFRMHLRAHGTVAEFCRELHDCPQHPELALLAALVLFVLSQDRLNMDLDTDTLKLILALSKADDCKDPVSQNNQENLETLKHRQRVFDLCMEMKNRGHATHLKLDKITASELALETLLHLTSKRAGEWVKHELRALGGLDSIVNEVDSSLRFAQMELVQFGWTEGALERLRKVDRCLQVLQQVTFNHEHNQKYLLGRSEREVETPDGGIIHQKCVESSPKIFVELFRFCKDNLLQLHMQLESAAVMREILFSVLRVLVNLSHDYRGIVLGSEILLAMDGFLQLCLHSTFEMGHYFPDEKIFDLLMHSLCMLLNLVEHSSSCRNAILTSTVHKSSAGNYRVLDSSASISSDDSGVDEEISVLDAFVEMFLCRERAAKKEEQHTDNILTKGPEEANSSSDKGDSANGSQDKNSQDSEGSSLQDTIDKLIQTAGKHMENSLIAAYISLLLAYIIMDNPMAASQVRNSMPNGQYLPLMIFLKKLFNFMSITSSASGSIRGLKATAIALRFFAKEDPKSEEELKKLIPD